jgi:hypothetical protein
MNEPDIMESSVGVNTACGVPGAWKLGDGHLAFGNLSLDRLYTNITVPALIS